MIKLPLLGTFEGLLSSLLSTLNPKIYHMPLYDITYCMKQVEQLGRQLKYRWHGSVNILIYRDIQIKNVFQSLCVNTVDIVQSIMTSFYFIDNFVV